MNNPSSPADLRLLTPIGYGLALMLLIGPLLDLAVATWPWQPASIQWRFGLLGLLGNTLVLPTLAIALLAYTAASLSHRRVLRVLSAITLVTAVALTLGLISLSLDALQLRRSIRAEIRVGYDYGAVRVAVNYLLAIMMTAWVGAAGWRASKLDRSSRRTTTPTVTGPLVSGSHRALAEG